MLVISHNKPELVLTPHLVEQLERYLDDGVQWDYQGLRHTVPLEVIKNAVALFHDSSMKKGFSAQPPTPVAIWWAQTVPLDPAPDHRPA